MKKMILILILISFSVLFALAGCDSHNSQPATESEREWSYDTDTSSDNIAAGTTPSTNPLETDKAIDTEYYTVKIPASWENDCLYEIADGEHYNYTLSFYDKASHEETNCGWLFSINLLTEFEDYTNYPNYDVLGSIEVYRIGAYNIVVTFPTDVPCSKETEESYIRKGEAIPQILESISFKEECTFSTIPLEIQELPESEGPVTEEIVSRANGIWHYTINRLDMQTLQIFDDNTFLLHYISAGKVKETIEGTYTIVSDDGKYQEFMFEEYGNAGATWTAKIWQTELIDSNDDPQTGLVYINAENETIYYTGSKW